MYICLCHAVTDKKINESIENGASSVKALMKELKVATQCGCCLDDLSKIVSNQNDKSSISHDSHISDVPVHIFTPA